MAGVGDDRDGHRQAPTPGAVADGAPGQRQRRVEQGNAGSHIEYLRRQEQWLRRLAADAPIDEV